MASPASDFEIGRCIKWCTELPNRLKSFKSPVFMFQDRECYFELNRRQGPAPYYKYCHSVYLKQAESPIKLQSFAVEVRVGLLTGGRETSISYFTKTITDTENETVWSMDEKDLKVNVVLDFHYGNVLKFVFIFNSRVAPYLQLETDNKSVQTSISTNPAGRGSKSCLEYLSEDFCKLLEDADHDVVLKSGERTLRAHKIVLRARSSVFAAMLRSDVVEGRTSCVELQDMNEVLLQDFVRYLYSGAMPELSWDSTTKLYAVGDKYAVEGLKKRCAIFLAENLTPENACACLALADAHNDSDLKECVILYILDKEIPLLDDQWLPFVREYLALAAEVLRRSYQLQKQARH